MSTNNAVLEGRNLNVSYGTRRALRGVDLSLYQGELLCVVGPNGSGKSTLVKALTGLVALQEGQVRLGGKLLSDYSRT